MTTKSERIQVAHGLLKREELDGRPLVLAHGGAGPQDPKGEKFLSATEEIKSFLNLPPNLELSSPASPWLRANWEGLSSQMRATLLVIRRLEASSRFNAGFGASLQADGVVRVSASLMVGRENLFSAVMNGQNIQHPSELALYLQNQRFSILDSFGTNQLARELAIPSSSLVSPERFRRWRDNRRQCQTGRTGTIGCVSVGEDGQVLAATSTGGVGNETPGRVGDTPTIAGNYCGPRVAISCTGIGEQIIAHALAPRVALYFEETDNLANAVTRALYEAEKREYRFALIAVAHSADQIQWAAGALSSQLVWARG